MIVIFYYYPSGGGNEIEAERLKILGGWAERMQWKRQAHGERGS